MSAYLIPIEMLSKESKAEIDINPVTAEAKIRVFSII